MPRHRDPEVSRKVEKARAGLDDGTYATIAAAARAVDLVQPTLRYRLQHPAPPAAHRPDNLTETPGGSELRVIELDYTKQASHRIYPIGDLHIGAKAHAGGVLDEWFDYLLTQDAVSMLNTGDNFNAAIIGSVSDVYEEILTPQKARQLVTEKFRPLEKIIDVIIDGNHERRIVRSIGDSPNSAVADALGINYEPNAVILRYHVGDVSYDVFVRHGQGGGGSMGAAVNNLEKQERIVDADVYVSGHTHTQVAFPKNVFVPHPDEAKVERKKRLFVCSGSFLAYEEYAKVAGYPPAHIGAPRIFLDGRVKDAHASV